MEEQKLIDFKPSQQSKSTLPDISVLMVESDSDSMGDLEKLERSQRSQEISELSNMYSDSFMYSQPSEYSELGKKTKRDEIGMDFEGNTLKKVKSPVQSITEETNIQVDFKAKESP